MNGKPHDSMDDKFWKFVKKTDHCWIWVGAKNPKGYGHFGHLGKTIYAHRFSHEIHNGPIQKGHEILHNCQPLPDNKSCVNPHHLGSGTHVQNMFDKLKKGQQPYGEKLPQSKLTNAKIAAIRNLCGESPQSKIAKQFGVSQSTVSHINTKKSWAHI